MGNNIATIERLESTILPVSSIMPNDGQIDGLPRNPRFIRDEKFEALKRSILENPEMLGMREILVYPFGEEYVAIGGNMRIAALKDIGINEVPCKILPADSTPEQLRAYTMKDNYGYGEWDSTILAEEWDMSELDNWDMNDIMGFDVTESEVEEGVEDYSSKNREIDVEGFDDNIIVKLSFSIDENRYFRERLAEIDDKVETAILKVLGYEASV